MEIFDKHYFFVNKTLLKGIGLWPYESYRRKLCIRTFINVIIGICVTFPQLVRIYSYFGVNMAKLFEHVAVLMFVMTIYLKFLTSIFYEKKLKMVYDNIANNWQTIKNEDEVNILVHYSKSGLFLTISYIIYITVAACSYVLLPIVPIILDIFVPLNQTRPRFYIFGGEYFIIDNVEDYGKVYAFDSVVAVASGWIICAVDSMYAASIEHCIGLISIVKLRLQICTHSNCAGQNDNTYRLIVQLIRLHKDIINFSDILESSYSSSFLILVGINVIFLSFECIIVLSKFEQVMELLRYTQIMIGIVVHLFFISWPGQKLTDFSLGLFQDAYLNEWYMCSTRAQKLLYLMTMRCSKPCQLTAGRIYVMNFSNFAMIVKTSLSYMTVLASFR